MKKCAPMTWVLTIPGHVFSFYRDRSYAWIQTISCTTSGKQGKAACGLLERILCAWKRHAPAHHASFGCRDLGKTHLKSCFGKHRQQQFTGMNPMQGNAQTLWLSGSYIIPLNDWPQAHAWAPTFVIIFALHFFSHTKIANAIVNTFMHFHASFLLQ